MAEPVVPPSPKPCKIISREEAKAAGLKRYFSGIPCKHRHLAEQMVSSRSCVVCKIARSAVWYAENRERCSAKDRARYSENRDRLIRQQTLYAATDNGRARIAAYLARNAKKISARKTVWTAANPDMVRAHHANRRGRKRALPGKFSAADIAFLITIQGGKCAHAWCRVSLKKARHIDHIIPLARGGSNDRRNIQLLCPKCNASKGAKHPIDFAQLNGLLL